MPDSSSPFFPHISLASVQVYQGFFELWLMRASTSVARGSTHAHSSRLACLAFGCRTACQHSALRRRELSLRCVCLGVGSAWETPHS